MLKCQDSYFTTFSSYLSILDCHEEQAKSSQWKRCQVKDLGIEPLSINSPLYNDIQEFSSGTSQEAVKDTAANLGLALRVEGELYPIRDTAYKTLLDRAKIGGSALPKLSRDILAQTLNACLHLSNSDALLLIRDEKVSAVHSGDETDYSVLPINELLKALKGKLDDRFPGNQFVSGYSDHSVTSGLWTMPNQKDDLMGTYVKTLETNGQKTLATKLMPGIRFMTSDTGVASAKIAAMFVGGQYPIAIGGCIAVDHRHKANIQDFEKSVDLLFAKFSDNVKKLEKLLDVWLDYPVNAMTRICKKLAMPKKAAIEAIEMYKMAYGGKGASAHEVYMAMQEILFTLKTQNTPESKLLSVEENLTRALSLDWYDYDRKGEVEY